MPGKLINAFMTLFFRLLYHQFAWTYDFVANIVSFGQWQNWVKLISDQLEITPTLELGYGPGHLQKRLANLDVPIIGIDRSPQMSRIAARRLKLAGISPTTLLANSTAIPFRSNSFNQVIATFPSEYIIQPKTLLEIKRVLTPNGKLIILAMARITGRSLPSRIMAAIYRFTGQTVDLNNSFREKLLKPFRNNGFQTKIREVQTTGAILTYLDAVLIE